MEIIEAQPGWNVVTPQSMHATRKTTVDIYKEPVLAWHIETDMGKTTVMPITITWTISSPDVIFEKPDHIFVMRGVDHWKSEDEVLEIFKLMQEE
jgi:hypothetical protein